MEHDLYSPSELRRLLESENAAPLKKLGQNFLISERTVDRMIGESGITQDDCALEIGPGVGALTSKLTAAAKNVAAVEIDRKMAKLLETTAPGAKVLVADALKTDLAEFAAKEFGSERMFVFGNLPYYITSPLIMKLLEDKLPAVSITAMVQKEAGRRLCAPDGSRDGGAITLAVRYRAEPEILFDVPRSCFYPEPNVDSCVIRLTLRPYPIAPVSEKAMFTIIKSAFTQRRKTLLNSLSGSLGISKQEVAKQFEEAAVDVEKRAEALVLPEFIRLSDAFVRSGLL